MASGDTLLAFFPPDNEPPASNYATLDTRNNHPVLDFDAVTAETALFTGILPRNYAGGGITVYIHAALSGAIAGTLGWLMAFERLSDMTMDMDADSFAADQAVTAATVPGTSGVILVLSAAVSNGANMDSIAAGEAFRLRIKRDVANDTAAGDAELIAVELKET
ncbi:hypothetical protein [Nitrosospira sp. NpAV]|uniref:hypothetical protein n=1 Tax=Nitrosospira sp. NpAV TaxID=58133 RepID=UPI00059F5525|nr:hypothetical protein [Nitrosospira sp. NpAV]KIO48185.1 hypothetical protein SQ11_13585 [Nitrosospira sp. NpAV]